MTAAQLAAAGIGRGAIDHRLQVGRLHRLHAGVYSVEYVPRTRLTQMIAAVLACGPGAALSHRSAAALWGILKGGGSIEVTTVSNRVRPGLVVHRTRRLPAVDVTKRDGIPVTTLARTLADLAAVLDDRTLARALNEARIAHGLATSRLLDSPPLRRLIERGDGPTRSALEDEFLRVVARHGLPRPEVNRRVAGFEVDILWRAQRLVVELDGRRYHDTARGFERDRAKDAELVAAGYRVVRVTWARLTSDPGREARLLRKLLRQG